MTSDFCVGSGRLVRSPVSFAAIANQRSARDPERTDQWKVAPHAAPRRFACGSADGASGSQNDRYVFSGTVDGCSCESVAVPYSVQYAPALTCAKRRIGVSCRADNIDQGSDS